MKWATAFGVGLVALGACHADAGDRGGRAIPEEPTTLVAASPSAGVSAVTAAPSLAGDAGRAGTFATAAASAGTTGTAEAFVRGTAAHPEAGTSGAMLGAPAGRDASGAGAASSALAGNSSGSRDPRVLELLQHEWFSGPKLGYDKQYIDRTFDLGSGPFSQVTLTFQLESPCFPFDKWTQSPPPSGQQFPAQCDRFDRLMYFELDPANHEGAPPGTQVLRAITPYGGPLEKTVDITDLANARPGTHSLRSFVGTWVDDKGEVSGSDGGYFLSASVAIKPGPAPRRVLSSTALWSGWVGVETPLADLPFTLPEGTRHAELVYLVTGHGGAMDPSSACIGAADEFCKRTHHLYVDDSALTPEGFASGGFVPWRDDCSTLCTPAQGHPMMGSYCLENPNRAARNVTASRANWCPGDAVSPIVVKLSAAASTPGQHRARFAIDGIYPEGRWQVALVVYAYGEL